MDRDIIAAVVGIIIMIGVIAYSCHRSNECEKRGGTMIYGGKCIKAKTIDL